MTGQPSTPTTKAVATGAASAPSRVDLDAARKAQLAKPLYPSNLSVLFWASMAALRVAVIASTAVLLVHPMIQAFAAFFGLSELGTFFILGLGTHSAAVFGYIAFFAACDRFGWFQQYKLARPAPSERKNKPNVFKEALTAHFLWHFVVRVIEVGALWMIAPYKSLDTPLPSHPQLMWHFFGAFFVGEAFNYFFHRMQHESKFMAKHHKLHHEFVESESISAEYSDYIELVTYTALSYLFTSNLPMAIHFVTIVWKVAENQEVHSGYCFKGSLLSRLGLLYAYRTEFHDYHHAHREKKGSYGKPVYFDFWLKTCDDYLLELKEQGKKPFAW
jgi:sterol desaturase/sphingolipid hydroxylase (fatty acid hydroxylase superfamily)